MLTFVLIGILDLVFRTGQNVPEKGPGRPRNASNWTEGPNFVGWMLSVLKEIILYVKRVCSYFHYPHHISFNHNFKQSLS